MMKILIADDHPIVRSGLKQILGAEPDMVVVGEAENGTETLDLARKVDWDLLVRASGVRTRLPSKATSSLDAMRNGRQPQGETQRRARGDLDPGPSATCWLTAEHGGRQATPATASSSRYAGTRARYSKRPSACARQPARR